MQQHYVYMVLMQLIIQEAIKHTENPEATAKLDID